MARAGYCSACANYVFLRPDGGCANGHGPEYVSNPYDVPDAGAAPAAPPAYQPPAQPAYQAPAYQQPAYAAPVAPPKKKRTGCIIAAVIAALLVPCLGVVIFAALSGLFPNPFLSPEHQKVQAAGKFFEAVATADPVGLLGTIPNDAVGAADGSFWIEQLMDVEEKSSLKSTSWKNDVLTQVYADADGAERTVVYTAIDGDKVEANVFEEGSESGDPGYFTMVKEVSGWKVLALGSETEEFIRFDAATVKKLQEEDQ